MHRSLLNLGFFLPSLFALHDAWGLFNLQEAISLPDQLDEAANYIKSLKANVERMKEMKDGLRGLVERANTSCSYGSKSPQIQIQETGSSLVIVLNTGFNSRFIFNEAIRIVHEERAEVVNANFSVVDDDTVFHTIYLTVLIATVLSSHSFTPPFLFFLMNIGFWVLFLKRCRLGSHQQLPGFLED